MLDTKSSLILKILEKECKNGNYNIVEKADIISALPGKFRCEVEELDSITSYLERQDFISIKYDDDSVYCLCLLPKVKELTDKENRRYPVMVYVLVAILSLVGGLIGGILGQLIHL